MWENVRLNRKRKWVRTPIFSLCHQHIPKLHRTSFSFLTVKKLTWRITYCTNFWREKQNIQDETIKNKTNSLSSSKEQQKWYFVTKVVLAYCEKKCSTDQEKLLKYEAEGREFARFLRSLEQFIQTVKGQNNFW